MEQQQQEHARGPVTQNEPAHPSPRPRPLDQDFPDVGIEDDEIDEDQREEDVLREDLEHRGVIGGELQAVQVLRHAGKEKPGGEDPGGEDPQLEIPFPRDIDSEEVVDRAERDGEPCVEDPRKEKRRDETETERFIVMPEPVDLAPTGERRERHEEVERGGEDHESDEVEVRRAVQVHGDRARVDPEEDHPDRQREQGRRLSPSLLFCEEREGREERNAEDRREAGS